MAYDPQVRDMRPKLTGQGTYGPPPIPYSTNPRWRLWNYIRSTPAAQNSIVVNLDGTVIGGDSLTYEEMYGPQVHRLFVGGYDHRVDPAEDQFSYDALTEAGFGFTLPGYDLYSVDDTYTDVYPQVEGVTP